MTCSEGPGQHRGRRAARGARPLRGQRGQSMAEYMVILTFGFFGLLYVDDALVELLDTVHENYRGYSYAVSLSEYPDYDSIYEYGMDSSEARQARERVEGMMDSFEDIVGVGFPDLEDFEDIVGDVVPDSPADVLEGMGQFF